MPRKQIEQRTTIDKETRISVWNKYNHHCAYCGRLLEYKDMQVDHFIPLRAYRVKNCGTNSFENLMPSCRMCNHYKRAHSIETFRRYIAEIPKKLKDNYIYKVRLVYGNVIDNEIPIKFYYELIKEEQNDG